MKRKPFKSCVAMVLYNKRVPQGVLQNGGTQRAQRVVRCCDCNLVPLDHSIKIRSENQLPTCSNTFSRYFRRSHEFSLVRDCVVSDWSK